MGDQQDAWPNPMLSQGVQSPFIWSGLTWHASIAKGPPKRDKQPIRANVAVNFKWSWNVTMSLSTNHRWLRSIKQRFLVTVSPPLQLPTLLMKILYWNVRGISKPHLCRTLFNSIQEHKPHMVLLETRVCIKVVSRFVEFMNPAYPRNKLALGDGFLGGIWLFWDPNTLTVIPVEDSFQHITFSITTTTNIPHTFFLTTVYASLHWC